MKEPCIKRTYSTREEAESIMQSFLKSIPRKHKRFPEAIVPYYCEEHHGWHIGHDPEMVRELAMQGEFRWKCYKCGEQLSADTQRGFDIMRNKHLSFHIKTLVEIRRE